MISISLMSYRKSINQNQLTQRKFKDRFKNTKVTGYCENGKVMYKGNYKNGKKNGKWITYYKREKIKSKEVYKDGKKDGESITYDKNGKIKSKEIYKDGKRINYDTMSRFSHLRKTKVP